MRMKKISKAETLRLDHVSKLYGEKRGVCDLSFTAKAGHIIGILGKWFRQDYNVSHAAWLD